MTQTFSENNGLKLEAKCINCTNPNCCKRRIRQNSIAGIIGGVITLVLLFGILGETIYNSFQIGNYHENAQQPLPITKDETINDFEVGFHMNEPLAPEQYKKPTQQKNFKEEEKEEEALELY